ncbi:MAG: SRPBCC family protein [Saprospiraceae bacterium]
MQTTKQYAFVTLWKIEAPVTAVWPVIHASQDWPQWWKALRQVKTIRPGDTAGVGAITEAIWRTALPYNITFQFETTEVQPLQRIAGHAFGELEGQGTWSFTEENGVTTVRYDWQVATRKGWMNRLAFLLEPAFRWNHDVVMRWGGEGLAKRLNARLLHCS